MTPAQTKAMAFRMFNHLLRSPDVSYEDITMASPPLQLQPLPTTYKPRLPAKREAKSWWKW